MQNSPYFANFHPSHPSELQQGAWQTLENLEDFEGKTESYFRWRATWEASGRWPTRRHRRANPTWIRNSNASDGSPPEVHTWLDYGYRPRSSWWNCICLPSSVVQSSWNNWKKFELGQNLFGQVFYLNEFQEFNRFLTSDFSSKNSRII